MTLDHPLISREELEKLAATLIDGASRIEDVLKRLANHKVSEVVSELSEADQHAFTCVAAITERILEEAKEQLKSTPKVAKKKT